MDNNNNNKPKIYFAERSIVAIFCTVIALSVIYAMFFIYSPSHNALGALSSVSIDAVCMIFLIILISSFVFGNITMNRTTRVFLALLLASYWAMFLDMLNWIYDGYLSFDNYTFLFTAGSFCMGPTLACIFCVYIYCYMSEMHGMTKMHISAKVCAMLNLISIALALIFSFTRLAFTFVDGHYEIGTLYDVVTAVPILTMIYLTIYIAAHLKQVGWHDLIAVCGYILFMVAGALIEEAYRIGTTYASVAIANVFIFVMLQNEIIAREKRNAKKWKIKSRTDELTELLNRYAYEEEISKLEEAGVTEDFTYISADVNGLKLVNDTLGHKAGDELIIGVSECLEEALSEYGKLYRIGGDEFVALIDASEEQLNSIQISLDEVTSNWHGELVDSLTISCGFVTKREQGDMTPRQMAILADKRMYEAKAEFYRQSGVERRVY